MYWQEMERFTGNGFHGLIMGVSITEGWMRNLVSHFEEGT